MSDAIKKKEEITESAELEREKIVEAANQLKIDAAKVFQSSTTAKQEAEKESDDLLKIAYDKLAKLKAETIHKEHEIDDKVKKTDESCLDKITRANHNVEEILKSAEMKKQAAEDELREIKTDMEDMMSNAQGFSAKIKVRVSHCED